MEKKQYRKKEEVRLLLRWRTNFGIKLNRPLLVKKKKKIKWRGLREEKAFWHFYNIFTILGKNIFIEGGCILVGEILWDGHMICESINNLWMDL